VINEICYSYIGLSTLALVNCFIIAAMIELQRRYQRGWHWKTLKATILMLLFVYNLIVFFRFTLSKDKIANILLLVL
jgi:hypothetical protein